MDYQNNLRIANGLPTHIDGVLQPIYTFYGEQLTNYTIVYVDQPTPSNIFSSLNTRYTGAKRYYIRNYPTYRVNGELKQQKDWNGKLYFHKPWSRKDIEINEVSYNIVGIKRATTHLPAGVLINNVQFI
jgi:hypothetical protein